MELVVDDSRRSSLLSRLDADFAIEELKSGRSKQV